MGFPITAGYWLIMKCRCTQCEEFSVSDEPANDKMIKSEIMHVEEWVWITPVIDLRKSKKDFWFYFVSHYSKNSWCFNILLCLWSYLFSNGKKMLWTLSIRYYSLLKNYGFENWSSCFPLSIEHNKMKIGNITER